MHSGTLMHKGWFLGCGNWRDTQTGGGSSGPGRDVTAQDAVVTETERSELGKEFRVAHVHSAGGDVDAAAGHGLVAGAETDTAFDALEFGHHNRIRVLRRFSASRGEECGASGRG